MPGYPRYRIRNWAEHQHYKDRNPPWIKLSNGLLTSEDWVTLSDASRVLLIASMLLASRTGRSGEFCGNPEYVKRVAYLNKLPDFDPLVKCGFLEVSGDALQNASNMLQNASSEGEESRGETEERQRKVECSSLDDNGPLFLEWWERYPRKIGRKKCEKIFLKLSKPDRELAAGPAYDVWVKHWATIEDRQFIPHPSTWLNEERWESDPPPSKHNTPPIKMDDREFDSYGWSRAERGLE